MKTNQKPKEESEAIDVRVPIDVKSALRRL